MAVACLNKTLFEIKKKKNGGCYYHHYYCYIENELTIRTLTAYQCLSGSVQMASSKEAAARHTLNER